MDRMNEPTTAPTGSSDTRSPSGPGPPPEAWSEETGPELAAMAAPDDGVERPAKVMRIGAMTHQLLEEVRRVSLDETGRRRLREIYQISRYELAGVLSDELRNELSRLALPFEEDGAPTQNELQLAQSQLQGWLQGVFQGIQATLVAQQVAAQSQLAQGRHPQAAKRGQEEATSRAYL